MALSQRDNKDEAKLLADFRGNIFEPFLNQLRATDINYISSNMKKLEFLFARFYIKTTISYQTYEMVLKPFAKDSFKELNDLDLMKIEKIFTDADLQEFNIKQTFADFCKAIGKNQPSAWVKSVKSDDAYNRMSVFRPYNTEPLVSTQPVVTQGNVVTKRPGFN